MSQDPILDWLRCQATEARAALNRERDSVNISIMKQWVYFHECLLFQRREELDAEKANTMSVDRDKVGRASIALLALNEKEIKLFLKRNGLYRRNYALDEALNSGDGVYRP